MEFEIIIKVVCDKENKNMKSYGILILATVLPYLV